MQVEMEKLRQSFEAAGFVIAEEDLNVLYLALRLEKPLLVCGPPGVGKTDLAKVLSKILAARLIRLQCHEGLDESKALYDWNLQRQLVKIHLAAHAAILENELFTLSNILQRPLLQAITATEPVVLLIDEIDRSDPDFEAFLLEVLSDFQVSVPEIGTIKAEQKPVVIITSNGERELSEALRRRCIFLYLNFPGIEQEASIIKIKIPGVLDELREEMALAVARARDAGHHPIPGAESGLDWARALFLLDADHYQEDYVSKTLQMLAKNKENLIAVQEFLRSNNTAAPVKQERETK
ncbi:MAG: MoxR family ATPase [Thermacetogeniaceae bacterium]